MKTRAKPNAKRESNATNRSTIVAGEIFADGAMIELVSGSSRRNKPDLLLWTGHKATIGPRVKHGGCIYEAPELPPTLYRATRFPSRCADYGSAHGLFDSIEGFFKRYLDFPQAESRLLACFSIITWLADRLPIAPTLVISGPDQELGIDVLRLLGCFCRHPLMLSEVTPGGFRSLPMQLSLTLLLNQQELKPNLQRLFRASTYRGLHLPGNGGSVVDLYGPKAILCGNDAAVDALGGGVIRIFAAPSQSPSSILDERSQKQIANDFQPRLLMYRLKNLGKVRESPVDISNFTSASRQLARAVAACFPEDSELAHHVVELLRPQDDEIRGQRSVDVNCVIVEILWGAIHHGKQQAVRVDDLAEKVNALLRSRGETLSHSAEEIGWKLRSLNIPRHSRSAGREVSLGLDISHLVHKLARAYELPCAQRPADGRPDCKQGKPAVSK